MRSLLFGLGGAVSALLSGCACQKVAVPYTALEARNILFNPPESSLPIDYPYASDWPSTEALTVEGEVLFYRETVMDIQDRRLSDFEGPYRRFQVVREGRGYR